jgi:hypothetical protein
MASKHMMPTRRLTRTQLAIATASLVLAFTAIVAALAAHALYGGGATAARQITELTPVSQQQPVSQEGRLVSVTPTSVTAESVDGFARTYVIDSQTNAITERGSNVGGAGTTFAVNDEVSIVGVVRNGTAVATAVADKQVSDLNGPPMDGA